MKAFEDGEVWRRKEGGGVGLVWCGKLAEAKGVQ